MFDQLFEVPRTIILHDLSPLALERSRYLIHLTKEGMAKASVRSIAEYLLVIVEYLKLAERSTESVCRD